MAGRGSQCDCCCCARKSERTGLTGGTRRTPDAAAAAVAAVIAVDGAVVAVAVVRVVTVVAVAAGAEAAVAAVPGSCGIALGCGCVGKGHNISIYHVPFSVIPLCLTFLFDPIFWGTWRSLLISAQRWTAITWLTNVVTATSVDSSKRRTDKHWAPLPSMYDPECLA